MENQSQSSSRILAAESSIMNQVASSVPLVVVVSIVIALVNWLMSLLSKVIFGNSKSADALRREAEERMEARVQALEQRLDNELYNINQKLSEIKSKLDVDSGREHPSASCRSYMDHKIEALVTRMDSLIGVLHSRNASK